MSSKATTVMVLGIVSLVLALSCGLGLIPAIVALVMAGGAEREIAASEGALDGQDRIKAGRIMSWISIGFVALAALFVLVVFAIGLASSNTA
ncbi:MAG: penetrans ue family 26 [Actinomycetota bacterium]|jgi:hypothetical protein|nr:penetrans ue family 26 [Actinomycetota bacterium]